jgi:beta-glucosidase
MSDWSATHSTLPALRGGLDLEMPSAQFFNAAAVNSALSSHEIGMNLIDTKALHILHDAVRFGWLDRPQRDLMRPLYDQISKAVALQSAEESMVLLRNDGALLPLDRSKLKVIALIGPLASPAVPTAGGSGEVATYEASSLLSGLSEYLGPKARVLYDPGISKLDTIAVDTPFFVAPDGKQGVLLEVYKGGKFQGPPTATRVESHLIHGHYVPFGSIDLSHVGEADFSSNPDEQSALRFTTYLRTEGHEAVRIFLEDASPFRLYVDDVQVADDDRIPRAVLNSFPVSLGLGWHKIVLESLPGTEPLMNPQITMGVLPKKGLVHPAALEMAAAADVVVVPVGFTPRYETESSDRAFELPPGQQELIDAICRVNPHVVVLVTSGGPVSTSSWLRQSQAAIELWYPGQEGGRAVAETLFGDNNPSGHLPMTWDGSLQDNPAFTSYYYGKEDTTRSVLYKEGLFGGYRGYSSRSSAPQFPFGYGLSYTTFEFRDLHLKSHIQVSDGRSLEVEVTVINTGDRDGAVVPQLYVPTRSGVEGICSCVSAKG